VAFVVGFACDSDGIATLASAAVAAFGTNQFAHFVLNPDNFANDPVDPTSGVGGDPVNQNVG
jgi:hypothetical protein